MKALKKLYTGIRDVLANDKPKQRVVYAVTKGDYLGEFLVYVEETDLTYCFLSLPDMHIRDIPKSDTASGLQEGILDKVETLPRDVFSICHAQYVKSRTNRETDEIVPINPQLDT